MDLEQYLDTQQRWSRRTFGQGKLTTGITDHIRKELEEIEASPDDLMEWIDVCILAMEGFLRAGGTPIKFIDMLQGKQDINLARKWPAFQGEGQAMEHIRD